VGAGPKVNAPSTSGGTRASSAAARELGLALLCVVPCMNEKEVHIKLSLSRKRKKLKKTRS
jgi:hypothetical protein